VSDQTTYTNLLSNGYNFYGAYGTGGDTYVHLKDGSITGDFKWADSYINQIWMNNNFQVALADLMTSKGQIPYNKAGFAMIETALLPQINKALTFGAIQTGVTLSSAQIVAINNTASTAASKTVDISNTLETRGWYLQIVDPGTTVRIARGTPICNFWYTDGESVQKITLASIAVL